MREFSKVSPSVWKSIKFRSLKDHEAQRVYLYLLSCPHGNSIGCFDLPPGYAADDLDMSAEGYRNCMDTLSKAGLVEMDWDQKTVLIVNWEEFNEPANINHAKGMIAQFRQVSSERLKDKCFAGFVPIFIAKGCDKDASFRKAWQPLFDRYRNGIPTETKRERETKTETRPDQTKTETRETALAPSPPAAERGGSALEGVGAANHLDAALTRLEAARAARESAQPSTTDALEIPAFLQRNKTVAA